jgi:hypothetical protein
MALVFLFTLSLLSLVASAYLVLVIVERLITLKSRINKP